MSPSPFCAMPQPCRAADPVDQNDRSSLALISALFKGKPA
jgi:hypothetical protein